MGIDVSAVARVMGIEPVYKDLRGAAALFLPARIIVIGQGTTLAQATYSNNKTQVFSAFAVGSAYGFGSPLHLACLQYFPANGKGAGTIPVTLLPLSDHASGVASVGDVAPTGTNTKAGAYRVRINNILSDEFVIDENDTVTTAAVKITTAVNGQLQMPVIAATQTAPDRSELTSKWKGASANGIKVSVEGPSLGMTFAITQPVGGLVNPGITAALGMIGNVWETHIHNCLDIADAEALDALNTEGELRWGPTFRKPFLAFTGNVATTVANAIAIPDARKTDRVNCQLVAPGSTDLPFVTAASQLVRIARTANNEPPRMYSGQVAQGLTPGGDADQWTHPQRDAAMKGGSSTVEIVDGEVQISNVITFQHPTGEPIPAYRYAADVTKLKNTIFNLDLAFATDDWKGAVLVPDGSPAVENYVKQPKQAVAEVATVLDALELAAIIVDAKAAKKTIVAVIDSQNPKRLNVSVTVQLSGNANIIDVTLNFGFFFGDAAVAA